MRDKTEISVGYLGETHHTDNKHRQDNDTRVQHENNATHNNKLGISTAKKTTDTTKSNQPRTVKTV